MPDDLERRLDAVERAITGDDRAVADLADAAELSDRVETVAERTDDLERRLAELEAAVRALRGYVGHERASGGPADGDAPSTTGETRDGTDGTDPTADAGDRDGPASAGVTAGTSEDDGGTRRLDVDVSDEWPTGDAARAEGDDGPGARDVRRLDAKPGGASEDAGRTSVGATRDDRAEATTGDGEDGAVAWDWNWATTDDGAGHSGTDGTGERGESRPDGGTDLPDEARVDRPGHGARANDADGRETASGRGTADDRSGSPGSRWDAGRAVSAGGDHEAWDPSGGRWPDPDDATPVDDRRPGASDDWPEGLDVERAQPWSVPDPPRVAAEEREEDDGLLERLREAL